MDSESNEAWGRVITQLARQVELALVPLDLTHSQYRLLGMLAEGTEVSSALADKLAVSRPSVTGVVDGLVARGLVTRTAGGTDRRRVAVAPTAEGVALLVAANRAIDDRLDGIAALLDDPGAQEAALAGLAAWRLALRAHRATCCDPVRHGALQREAARGVVA